MTKSTIPVITVLMGIMAVFTAVCATPNTLFSRNLQTVLPTADTTHNKALSVEELRRESQLSSALTCDYQETRLDDALEALTRQTGVKLTVISELTSRKFNCCCTTKPLSSLLISLSRVLNVSWRKVGNGYELFQTREQLQTENREKRRSEQREQDFLKTQDDLLHRQIVGAMFQNGIHHNDFADFLSGCSSETIDKSIPSALEDEPFISATDQSHFHNHLFALKPFSTLLPTQQRAVTNIAQDCGYSGLSANSQVGLIAAAGSLRLGIVEPDGKDVWVAPKHQLGQVSTISEQTRQNDFDDNVRTQLRSDSICDLKQLSKRIREKKLPTEKSPDDACLGVLLKNIAKPLGIDFISDSYLNSSRTNYLPLFKVGSEWTVETALRQIAKTFGHKTIYRNDFLELSTITLGLDTRLEPPVSVMNSLDAQLKAGRLPNKADLLAIAPCTKEQLQLLALKHPVIRKTNTLHIYQALHIYPFLHFYASLTPKQQQEATSENGLNLHAITTAQRRVLDELTASGLPKPTPAKYKWKKHTFYVKFGVVTVDKGRKWDIISFVLTLSDATRCRRAAL